MTPKPRTERCDTKIKALTRAAYGFKFREALIALATLTLSRLDLPHQQTA